MTDNQHRKNETEDEKPFEEEESPDDNPFGNEPEGRETEEEPEEETHVPVEDLPEEKPSEEAEPAEEDEDILLPLDDEASEEKSPPEKEEFSMPSGEEKAPPAKEAAEEASDEEILLDELGEEEEEKAPPEEEPAGPFNSQIFILRTTANREEQVLDFLTSNASKKGLEVFSVIHPHGMRGYLFVEAGSRSDAEQAAFRVPYARGLLPSTLQYAEIEHMLEKTKKIEMNIRKNDIAEIISGPFKREKCKISRIDKAKEEVVVELLEAAVPIPITLKMDAIKVIRRDSEEEKK